MRYTRIIRFIAASLTIAAVTTIVARYFNTQLHSLVTTSATAFAAPVNDHHSSGRLNEMSQQQGALSGDDTARNIAILREWYESGRRGVSNDIRLRMLDPKIEFALSPGLPHGLGRTYYGTDAIKNDLFVRLGRYFTEWNQREKEYVAMGNAVCVVGTYNLRTSEGRRVNTPFVHVWHFRNGKPTAMQQITDTQLINSAFDERVR